MGCERLRSNNASMALVGGIHIIDNPELYVALSESDMISKNSKSCPFDEKSDGYLRGEGCGFLVLQRVSSTTPVYAWIDGESMCHNGHSSTLMAPNGPAQENNIKKVLALTHKTIEDVDFVESGSPGTKLGDPVEAHAIRNVFENEPNRYTYHLSNVILVIWKWHPVFQINIESNSGASKSCFTQNCKF